MSEQNDYSRGKPKAHHNSDIDDDDLLTGLVIDSSGEATADEIIAALGDCDPPATAEAPEAPAAPEPEPDHERSNKVQAVGSNKVQAGPNEAHRARSNKVSPRKRRSASKDRQTIEKLCAFGQGAQAASNSSSVATSTLITNPSLSPLTPGSTSTPRPNTIKDNHLPQWEHTSEAAKAFAATVALLVAEKPAHAFSFNLTSDATADLMRDPKRFLDSLKRAFDRELKRRGIDLPNYIFGVDQDWDKRLHLHGAFGDVPPELLPAIRDAMKKAWGEQHGPGKQFQLKIEPLYNGGRRGWGDYITKNRRRFSKIIGETVTITNSLRREASSTYDRIRSIIGEASELIGSGYVDDEHVALEIIDMGNGLSPLN
jgi:hypothetical protein